jgi:hypothetical protein
MGSGFESPSGEQWWNPLAIRRLIDRRTLFQKSLSATRGATVAWASVLSAGLSR